MFGFVIVCPRCGYESNSYADGLDILQATYTVIFVNKADKSFRVVDIGKTEMAAHGGDLDTGLGVEEAIRSIAASDEDCIELPFGQDACLIARCPQCGNIGLQRKIEGLI